MRLGLYILTFFLLYSCATVDLPPGGDKDVTPPKVVNSNPDSAQTNFSGKDIKITFDEYFTTSNLGTELLVSPPFDAPIKSKINGRTLTLSFPEEFKSNSTYQVYFGNTIADLNEGNKTNNLRLVFSTGSSIDSSSLSGVVLDAFTREPVDACKVLLFKEILDSQLVKETPYYVTLTDKTGHFSFQNIGSVNYALYALNDLNNNNRLDQDEDVSFLSNTVESNTNNHTLLVSKNTRVDPLEIKKTKEISKGQFQVVFNQKIPRHHVPVLTTPNDISSITKGNQPPWFFGETRDTLYTFFPTQTVSVSDSLSLSILIDTQSFSLVLPTTKTTLSNPSIHLLENNITSTSSLDFVSNQPIVKTNTNGYHLFNSSDSIPVQIDTLLLTGTNTLGIRAPFEEGKSYQLIMDSFSLSYIHSQQTKRDTFSFQTLSPSKTSELELSVTFDSSIERTGQFILFLERQSESVKEEGFVITSDTILTFNFLTPGKYSAFIIQDLDNDKNWSAGNYFKNTSPEPIWRLNSPIELRANWKTADILLEVK